MDKLKMHTPNKADENFAKLAALFPNAVTETIDENGEVVRAIDKDVLMQEISTAVVDGAEERYQFTWPDKKKAVLAANSPIAKTLRPCRAESVDFDNTENLYIEGDNLDVLKLLQETYLGKVKMIYIDPPYNTGNDFVYNDDFAENTEDYLDRSGQFDEEGNRLVLNTESNGRFHTDWLNMIYPRLRLAKDLLTDDGVIFISIDDNEAHNLRKICDEVFGANNFLNQFSWVSNITGRQISNSGAAKTYEVVLVYAKNTFLACEFKVDITFAKEKMPDAYKGFNKDIREDSRGKFAIGDTLYNHNRKFNEETRPNLVFSIFYNPETETIITGDIGECIEGFVEIPPHANGDGVHKYHAWRWSKKKIAEESYDLIVLPVQKGYEVYSRIRNFDSTLLKDIITNISNGDSELQKLFDNKKYFNYPKSVDLLKLFIASLNDNDLILDFFSGSATTAHAVMQLNAEDGGNRKFIMVQLPEETDEKSEAFKAGYKNICEIGKERIRRAGAKIKEENPMTTAGLDTGFRVLKLDSTNMKDVYYNPDELILKNKERLLSFDEPTRFIFSHSALREGWDNPNVFQICTLKHSDSQTLKRQEVGRGLRLCVDQSGNRMDNDSCGDNVHNINMLTVIASESYKNFVADLQSDIKTVLYDRPSKATIEYFEGKTVMSGEIPVVIDNKQAKAIYKYLLKNDYIDDDDNVTEEYRNDLANNSLIPVPDELKPIEVGIHKLVQGIFDDSVLKDIVSDGHETKVKDNPLNENFYKKEFQTLWKSINHKYAYTVNFDSSELVQKAIDHINNNLYVSELQYTTTTGRQKTDINQYEIERSDSFDTAKTRTQTLRHAQVSQIRYDLIGKIAEGTVLTRNTVSEIIKGLRIDKFAMFKNNPEEFIAKMIRLICEQKATMIVDHISYNQIDGEYDSNIFTVDKSSQSFDKAFKAQKHVQDYVFTDGIAEKSVERRFAENLDSAAEVCVYAKLPKGFNIPTPLGHYSPDWAIAFNEGTVKHIYFIAETKGSMSSMDLRPIEKAKIDCAKVLFNKINTNEIQYGVVKDYHELFNMINR